MAQDCNEKRKRREHAKGHENMETTWNCQKDENEPSLEVEARTVWKVSERSITKRRKRAITLNGVFKCVSVSIVTNRNEILEGRESLQAA